MTTPRQRFESYSDLSREKEEGRDYVVKVRKVPGSAFSIVAPHGGTIEFHTSDMARKIAANDHSYYVFEGLEEKDAFFELHVESRFFDDPRCLDLIAETERTVTIHGCRDEEPVVYVGGLDEEMKSKLADAFNREGIRAEVDGHKYPGTADGNICNLNKRKMGVQLEFSRGIRDNAVLREKCVGIVRNHLKGFSS